MDNAEKPKEWYVTHNGQQYGPVSIDDLKFESKRGELNPRLDMVWKNGMEDWIPAGDLEGLFEKNVDAEVAEKTKATAEPVTYREIDPEEERYNSMALQGNWGGAGRFTYFFITFIFPILFFLGIAAANMVLKGKVEPGLLVMISTALLLIPLILSLVVLLKRFTNLAMSRWWFFGQFVPILNLWVLYRVFACPPGYAMHKKMDPIGWFLAIFYWLLNLLILAAVAGFIYLSANNPEKLKELITGKEAKQFTEFMEKARERGEQLSAPEEEEKPPEPSITPY